MEVDQDDAVFIRYLKLVVAIAIIRSRPSGLSGQQYAQSLCKQYQKSQLSWKAKAKSLEQELLLARQKALHSQLTKAVQPKSASDDAFPTPPSSAEATAYGPSDSDSMTLVNFSDHRTILSKHTSFLQSIITLSSLSSRSGIWDNAEITSHTLDIIKSSLDSITDFLVQEMNNNYSGLREGLGSEVGLHSVTVVSQLADMQTGSRCTMETVHRLILKSAQRFIDTIVNNNSLNKFAMKFQTCRYILMLAKASVLREGILWLLLQQVVACSELLRLSINKEVTLEPHTMENIYYIFWCIEQLLCGDSGRGGQLRDKLCRDVAFLLSESLLHISQNFPIFAHYIWHIGELVEGVKKK